MSSFLVNLSKSKTAKTRVFPITSPQGTFNQNFLSKFSIWRKAHIKFKRLVKDWIQSFPVDFCFKLFVLVRKKINLTCHFQLRQFPIKCKTLTQGSDVPPMSIAGRSQKSQNDFTYIHLSYICVCNSLTHLLCPPLKTFNFSQQGQSNPRKGKVDIKMNIMPIF